MKKLLSIIPTLNLDLPYGLTPAVWQMMKAFYELGIENIVVPYRGKAFRSLWWKSYSNPAYYEGELFSTVYKLFNLRLREQKKKNEGVEAKLAQSFTMPKWKRHLKSILEIENNIGGVFFIQIPLNQIKGLASWIKNEYGLPCVYFESDVPTSLPEHGGFSFNHFLGSDLSEFNSFVIASEGSKKRLLEMGANKVHIMHFGVDPDVYMPISREKETDVFFSGNGSNGREQAINDMLVEPSLNSNYKYVVSGKGYDMSLGKVNNIPPIPFNSWREYCCSSKINLNIARLSHSLTRTSTSRPFELAAMKCCVVSCPYAGLSDWFDLKNEMLVVNNTKEAMEIYVWLLDDTDERNRLANNAYNRVLKEHTFYQRCKDLLPLFE